MQRVASGFPVHVGLERHDMTITKYDVEGHMGQDLEGIVAIGLPKNPIQGIDYDIYVVVIKNVLEGIFVHEKFR